MPPITSVLSRLLLKLDLNLLDNPRGHLPAEPLEAVGAGFDRSFGDFELFCQIAKFSARQIHCLDGDPIGTRLSGDWILFGSWHYDRLKPVGGYDLGALVISGL